MRLLLCFLLLASCTTGKKSVFDFKRRKLTDYFIGSGVVRYFLPTLPVWANYSQTGKCQRSSLVRYLDLEKLRGSYNLTYEQALQFQYMFNMEYSQAAAQVAHGILPFKEEETLFYNVSDKVQSNIKIFREPSYKRVNLIWIDPALSSENNFVRLMKLMKSDEMDDGHPVFISLCLDSGAIKKFLTQNQFDHPGTRIIPIEMFSVFGSDQKRRSQLEVNISEVISVNKEVHFYVIGRKPRGITGKFKMHRY